MRVEAPTPPTPSTPFSDSSALRYGAWFGQVFCQKCSSLETVIPALNITKPVRVCSVCYDDIMAGLQRAMTGASRKSVTVTSEEPTEEWLD